MRKLLKSLLKIKPIKSLIKFFVVWFFNVYNKLKDVEKPFDKDLETVKKKLNASHIVLNGPFKGLRYSKHEAFGSAKFPKILGSYEQELHPVIKRFSENDYTEILDVGCAEGYYVVGMALNHITTRVYAYDISLKARQLCFELAKLNHVENQVIIQGEFTPEALAEFNFTGKSLILCDCEGFEKTLFNTENLDNLRYTDIIIETHDLRDIEISSYLKDLFKDTHDIESIYSVDDIQKAIHYKYDEIEHLKLDSKYELLREGRGTIMEWLICTPK